MGLHRNPWGSAKTRKQTRGYTINCIPPEQTDRPARTWWRNWTSLASSQIPDKGPHGPRRNFPCLVSRRDRRRPPRPAERTPGRAPLRGSSCCCMVQGGLQGGVVGRGCRKVDGRARATLGDHAKKRGFRQEGLGFLTGAGFSQAGIRKGGPGDSKMWTRGPPKEPPGGRPGGLAPEATGKGPLGRPG